MNRPIVQLLNLLIMLLTSALAAIAQAQNAQIPESFHGTYSLTFQTDHPQAPLPDGTQAELVLAPGGVLCVADFLMTNRQLTVNNSEEAFWTAGDVGVRLAVSDITGSFNEVNVLALDGTLLGQMTGTKISDSTACGSLSRIPDNIDDIDDVFSLAEQAFPDLFPTDITEASLRILDEFIYRQYVASGTFIGINVSDNNVYLLGGPFGSQAASVGSISSIVSQLSSELGLEPPAEEGPMQSGSGGPTGIRAGPMVLDADQGRVILLDSLTDTIFSVDLADGSRTVLSDNQGAGEGPALSVLFNALAIDQAGDRLLVPNVASNLECNTADLFNDLLAIDLVTGERTVLSGTSDDPGLCFQNVVGMAIDSVGERLFVQERGIDRPGELIVINLITGERTLLSQASGTFLYSGPGLEDVAYDASRNRLLVTSSPGAAPGFTRGRSSAGPR